MTLKIKPIRIILLIILSILFPLLLSFTLFEGTTLNFHNKLFGSLVIISFQLFMTLFFGYLLLTKICKIRLDDNFVYLHNLVTRRNIKISYNQIGKIQSAFWNNTIDLINDQDNKIIRIDKDNYSNLTEFIKILNSRIELSTK